MNPPLYEIIKNAWKNRADWGGDKQQSEYEFLPAALEIQEKPPHPLSRWLAWSLMALFLIAIFWACIGKVNVVAIAEGKIIPGSRIKTIQPLDKGVIKTIYVHEGKSLKAGDPLIELDQTLTHADKQRLAVSLNNAQLEKQRLEQFIHLLEGKTDLDSLDIARNLQVDGAELNYQNQLLSQQWLQYRSRLAALHSTLAAKQAELETTQAHIERLQQTLPIIRNRAEKIKQLMQQKMAAEEDFLSVEQQRIETQQNLIAEQAKSRQLAASLEEIIQQKNAIKAETLAGNYQQLAQTQQGINQLQEELKKAADLNARQILYAPVDGVVQEIKVSTIGGVVMEAQDLMTLVPANEQLEVQAFLANKDIGYVQKDMPAEIKIHTFPFTKHGVINAMVKNITDDAIKNEENGLVFAVQLLMDKNTINVNGRDVRLVPGMAVTAEMIIEERRIIEFLLNPIKKGFAESLRER